MAKFKPGDKVCITAFKYGEKRHYNGGFNVGDIITITMVHAMTSSPDFYDVAETDDYIFFEDELELVKSDVCNHDCSTCTCHDDTVTISVDIPLNDKKEAHRIVHAMVKKAYQDAAKSVYKHELWSKAEITLARDLVVAQADQVIRSGGDLLWHYTAKENEIEVVVYESPSESGNIRSGRAAPHHADEYNEWIGKCVSLYKALNMEVPTFISHKNMED